jgi:hypothetical protein
VTRDWLPRLQRLLGIVIVMVIAGAVRTSTQDYRYGMVTFDLADPMKISKMNELGAGTVRASCQWNNMESVQGVRDLSCISEVLQDRGAFLVYMTIWGTPNWANGNNRPNIPPINMSDWYNFMSYVFQVYGGQANVVWGIWNEPDIGDFLQDSSGNAYWQLFSNAASARNDNAPTARLAGPETSVNAWGTNYYQGVIIGINPVFAPQDVVSVHWNPTGPEVGSYMDGIYAYANYREVWLTEIGINYDCCSQSYW